MTIKEAIENNLRAKNLYDNQLQVCLKLNTETQWEKLTKYRNQWTEATKLHDQLITKLYNERTN